MVISAPGYTHRRLEGEVRGRSYLLTHKENRQEHLLKLVSSTIHNLLRGCEQQVAEIRAKFDILRSRPEYGERTRTRNEISHQKTRAKSIFSAISCSITQILHPSVRLIWRWSLEKTFQSFASGIQLISIPPQICFMRSHS
ncbi:hypothetical protein ONS95_003399 [Cadophora gregata]|uniref:uncharacterized protein n=1 Tax=Cadophora gregata TaxID=51156 RepID=UPI0026DD0972|nr:uncharacterized protein ONS95_003399 [Cadophora gregata]KAK0108603.1 hypothetical protein ONS95_003399 [Cadophora gregata]KAK0108804.1 hypothetical protein ONS96_002647 [Cadophora gregata f. sp. sojae]